MAAMTIGELAARVGVGVEMVRDYEPSLREAAAAEGEGLLRVLLVRLGAVPTRAGGGWLLRLNFLPPLARRARGIRFPTGPTGREDSHFFCALYAPLLPWVAWHRRRLDHDECRRAAGV